MNSYLLDPSTDTVITCQDSPGQNVIDMADEEPIWLKRQLVVDHINRFVPRRIIWEYCLP